jgi:hypothetical protein
VTQIQRPQMPTLAGAQEAAQRVLDESARLVRLLLDRAVFLTRDGLAGTIIAPIADAPIPALRWEALNRISLSADANVLLPRITSRYICRPLYLSKMTATGVLTLLPSGFDMSGQRTPLINNQASFSVNSAGLCILINDGQNWSLRY